MHTSKIYLFISYWINYFVAVFITGGNYIVMPVMISVLAAAGAISIRHLYLENNPPELFDRKGRLGYLLEAFPLTKIFPMIFRGTGDYSEVPWTFMGMSLLAWALAWFTTFMVSIILFGCLKTLRSEKPVAPSL